MAKWVSAGDWRVSGLQKVHKLCVASIPENSIPSIPFVETVSRFLSIPSIPIGHELVTSIPSSIPFFQDKEKSVVTLHVGSHNFPDFGKSHRLILAAAALLSSRVWH